MDHMTSGESHWPSVSVIVPVYNGQATIRELVESLLQIEYPTEQREIIVVDNNSSDQTAEIVKRYPVTLLFEKQIQSSYAARNRGADAAKGTFLAFTDADCVVTPQWLSKLLEHHQDETVGIFAGEVKSYRTDTFMERFADVEGVLDQGKSMRHAYLPFAVTANLAVRKQQFEAVGKFNASLTSGGDVDFSWRLQQQTGCRIQYVPDAVVRHRHRASVTTLYQQYRKYGSGVHDLQKLHPEAFPSISPVERLKKSWNLLMGTDRKGQSIVRSASGPLPSGPAMILVRGICIVGFAVGKMKAAFRDRFAGTS
jgi:glycosyltransferase involved in cell wall biosynthesis